MKITVNDQTEGSSKTLVVESEKRGELKLTIGAETIVVTAADLTHASVKARI